MFLCGVPIVWRSKQQKSVALSSSEAEFVAASEAVKEIIFVLQVLESMNIKVKTPVTVRVDNMGAIFMTENSSSGTRTRHIDTRWHFVRELVEGKVVEIIFVKSAENTSDGFTKNISGDLFEAHSGDYVWDKSDVGACMLDASAAGRVSKGARVESLGAVTGSYGALESAGSHQYWGYRMDPLEASNGIDLECTANEHAVDQLHGSVGSDVAKDTSDVATS
jgi:hypothetical protein